MPETVIELDLTAPWEPPEAPDPRPGGRRRWLGVLVVTALTAGLLGAAAPGRAAGPVFTSDFQAMSVMAAGGRAVVTRYRPAGAGAQLEAYRLRDGATLWSVPIELEDHLAYVTDQIVVLMTEAAQPSDPDAPASTLTGLDAATGRKLWQRAQTRLIGTGGERIVAEDMTGVLDEDASGSGYTEVDDPSINAPGERRDMRFVGLDERTGTARWEVSVPAGTAARVGFSEEYPALSNLQELTPTGLLREHDLRTGTVTATQQLDWSGTVSAYTTGIAGQVVVFRAGDRGADVFDRASGRRLWHWPGGQQRWSPIYACLPDRYCVQTGTGIATIDARTGRETWRADSYDGILRTGSTTLTVAAFHDLATVPTDIAVLDGRTGAVLRRVDDWYVVPTYTGPGLVVWRPINNRDAVLGTVDQRTGRIAVVGIARDWYGQPDCTIDGSTLVCVAVGALSVWRLP